jgi:hypothetical protein
MIDTQTITWLSDADVQLSGVGQLNVPWGVLEYCKAHQAALVRKIASNSPTIRILISLRPNNLQGDGNFDLVNVHLQQLYLCVLCTARTPTIAGSRVTLRRARFLKDRTFPLLCRTHLEKYDPIVASEYLFSAGLKSTTCKQIPTSYILLPIDDWLTRELPTNNDYPVFWSLSP